MPLEGMPWPRHINEMTFLCQCHPEDRSPATFVLYNNSPLIKVSLSEKTIDSIAEMVAIATNEGRDVKPLTSLFFNS